MAKISVDASNCIGCLYCQFLSEPGGMDVKSGTLAYMADESRCSDWQKLVAGCPEHAIIVTEA